jgi:hypothetical protein
MPTACPVEGVVDGVDVDSAVSDIRKAEGGGAEARRRGGPEPKKPLSGLQDGVRRSKRGSVADGA